MKQSVLFDLLCVVIYDYVIYMYLSCSCIHLHVIIACMVHMWCTIIEYLHIISVTCATLKHSVLATSL